VTVLMRLVDRVSVMTWAVTMVEVETSGWGQRWRDGIRPWRPSQFGWVPARRPSAVDTAFNATPLSIAARASSKMHKGTIS
jgi:hypothetical protein